jgi:hypothetical protein
MSPLQRLGRGGMLILVAGVTSALLVTAMWVTFTAQGAIGRRAAASSPGCGETGVQFPLPFPQGTQGVASVPSLQTRAAIRFGGSDWIELQEWEEPTLDGDYNSTLVLAAKDGARAYRVSTLVPGGDGLRLRQAQTICPGPNEAILVLAFSAGWIDAVQGFVILGRDRRGVWVQGLPLVDQGKLSASRRDLSRWELWSAVNPGDVCDACPQRYTVRECRLSDRRLDCGTPGPETQPISPARITGNVIDIRP